MNDFLKDMLYRRIAQLEEDSKMLNWLEAQNEKAFYTGKCIFRWSSSGRGWRLHETDHELAATSVREAIKQAMEREE